MAAHPNQSSSSVVSLFVTNFPDSFNEDHLRTIFIQHGAVLRATLKRPLNKPAFAFVEYSTYEEAQKAISALHRTPPCYMHVKVSLPKDENKDKQGSYQRKDNRTSPVIPKQPERSRSSFPKSDTDRINDSVKSGRLEDSVSRRFENPANRSEDPMPLTAGYNPLSTLNNSISDQISPTNCSAVHDFRTSELPHCGSTRKASFSSKHSNSSESLLSLSSQSTRGPGILGDSFKNFKVVLSASGKRCVYEESPTYDNTEQQVEKIHIPVCQRPHFRSRDLEISSCEDLGLLTRPGSGGGLLPNPSEVCNVSRQINNLTLQPLQNGRIPENEFEENYERRKYSPEQQLTNKDEIVQHLCASCNSSASIYCSPCDGWFCSVDCFSKQIHVCNQKKEQQRGNVFKGNTSVGASDKADHIPFHNKFEKSSQQYGKRSITRNLPHLQDGIGRNGCKDFQNGKFTENASSRSSLVPESPDILSSPPKLLSDSAKEIIITEIDSSSSFWARLCEEEERFTFISQKLRNTNLREIKNFPPKLGDVLAAKMFSNQGFCRCRVIEVKQKRMVNVIFIDTGSTKEIPSSELYYLEPSLKSFPPLAIHCKLDVEPDNKFRSESNIFLQKYVRRNNKLWAKQMGTAEDIFIVKLFTSDKKDIGDLLVEAGYILNGAQPSGNVVSALSKLDVNEKVRFTSADESPSAIMLGQIFSDKLESDIRLVMEDMVNDFKHRKTYGKKFSALPGMLVAALSKEDQRWYRAMVLKNDPEVSVCLIDYPSTEKGNEIHPLPEIYKDSASLAVRCEISNPNKEVFKSFVYGEFKELQVTKKENEKVFCHGMTSTGSVFEVCLTPWFTTENLIKDKVRHDSKPNSSNALQSQDRIYLKDLPKDAIPLGVFVSITPSWMESFESIYVNKKSDETKLQELSDKLQKYCNQATSDGYYPEVEEIVCAKFSDDFWYRAYITKVCNETEFSVYYIDYGNSAVVEKNNILPLPKFLMSYEQFAKRLSWNVERPAISLVDFASSLKRGEIFMKVVKEGDPLLADFYNSEECILDESGCFNKLAGTECSEVESVAEMCLLYLKDQNSLFFMRTTPENLASYEEITNKINRLKRKTLSNPKENMKCLAFSKADKHWYRAQIMKIENENAEVSYIDYGNSEKVPIISSLAEIPSDLENYPSRLIKCSLQGCRECLSSEQTERLESLLLLNQIYNVQLTRKNKEGVYSIEIPSLTKDLQAAGILHTDKHFAAGQEKRTKKTTPYIKKQKYNKPAYKGRKPDNTKY